jgi:hypothetical protein
MSEKNHVDAELYRGKKDMCQEFERQADERPSLELTGGDSAVDRHRQEFNQHL